MAESSKFPSRLLIPGSAILFALFAIVWYQISNEKHSIEIKENMGRLSKLDPNSFSNADQVAIRHIDLFWQVNFETKTISGDAVYRFQIIDKEIDKIFLDISDVKLNDIFIQSASGDLPVNYFVDNEVIGIGSKLTIELPTKTKGEIIIKINYETSPKAAALLWLTAEQTLGKKHPYLFSQCQAITARSLVPCQDTPAIKFTYRAVVKHPAELTALLSAIRVNSENGTTEYEQTVPIPSYLLAIAVGAVESRTIGPHSKVWAEKEIVDEAAEEFSETHKMLETASAICGEYVWKEYDLLVMPPSFPFGGMENPCLTFVTPTIIAGDKSLADVVAHEISHSWTGNLVTNRNFEHFWLNEGFTVFVENKIVGRLHGALAQDFHSLRNLNDLRDCLQNQLVDTPELTKLVVDLTNTSPDDAFSSVPYIKGSTFLKYLEDLLGGPTVFEPFLKFYLNKFKYKSIVTDDFRSTLYNYFQEKYDNELSKVDWDLWLYGVGMPPVIPPYNTTLADVAHNHAKLWQENKLSTIQTSEILNEANRLDSNQKIEFLSTLVNNGDAIVDLSPDWITLLESTYELNKTKNSEIRFRFLRLCIRARYTMKMSEILAFANSNFRMKFVRPIYRDLGKWPEQKAAAIANYEKVKDQMMSVCAKQVANDLGLSD